VEDQILRIKYLEQDFKYLYWTISKIIIGSIYPYRNIHYWLGRAGGLDREKRQKKFVLYFPKIGIRIPKSGHFKVTTTRRGCTRRCTQWSSYAASTMCCAQVRSRWDHSAELARTAPGEIMLWANNVNLVQTEVRADGGLANALRRLGHLRREQCRALWLRDEPVSDPRQLEHAGDAVFLQQIITEAKHLQEQVQAKSTECVDTRTAYGWNIRRCPSYPLSTKMSAGNPHLH